MTQSEESKKGNHMNLKRRSFHISSQVPTVPPLGKGFLGTVAQVGKNLMRFSQSRAGRQFAVWSFCLLLGLSATQVYALPPQIPSPRDTVSATTNAVANHTGMTAPQVSQADPQAIPTVAPVAQREFRGVWTASVANIDWPSDPNLSVEQQQAELLGILDRMQELNMNALVLQVRPAGDAFYASDLEPWSYWLTGTQGKAPVPFYDPLQFAIEESHKRNIELHAWLNPYRAKTNQKYTLAPNHMANKFPQYAYQYGDLLWMDPGAKPVQDHIYNVVMDVVRRYDLDAIHIDDYFYPYPKPGINFPDSRTYGAYRQSGGTLSLGDWRRQNVNELIQRLAEGIKAEKPDVKFGISPFGIYRPGKVSGIVGFDQYADLYADAKLWLEEGWVDYMAPQLYWRIDPPAQSYPVLLRWWVENNPMGRHIYAGNYLSQLTGADWPVSEMERQVEISRQEADRLSLGNIFFSMKIFKQNTKGVNDRFKASIYSQPALGPQMPWIDNEPPLPPIVLGSDYGKITWEADVSGDVRSWTLYRQKGNGWELMKILNCDTTSVQVPAGNYALRAVDRLANESPEEIITVN